MHPKNLPRVQYFETYATKTKLNVHFRYIRMSNEY